MRKAYIDILKILAAFCIVVLHINSNAIHQVYNFMGEGQKVAANTAHQLLYVSVPVFIILTGCGLFSSMRCSYKKEWPLILRILLCIVVFGLIFETARIVVRKESLTLIDIVSDLINGTTWSHMWYLNKLLGLYLVAPVICSFLKESPVRDQVIFTALCISFEALFPHISGFTAISVPDFFPISGMFVGLAMVGYLIEKIDGSVLRKWIIPFGIVLLGCIVGIIVLCSIKTDTILLENNPVTIITAISVVLFFKGLFADKASTQKLEEFSRCTLGVYIIHPVFVHFIIEVVKYNPHIAYPVISVPAMGVVVFLISSLVIFLLRRIPGIKKFI